MLRTFTQHVARMTSPLEQRWEFVTADERDGETGLPETYSRLIQVPSAWEMLPGLENYRGKAWYRTTVRPAPGLMAGIVFGGVSHTAIVYVDGHEVGRHYDAFTPWDVLLGELSEGDHDLVVEVDNSFGEHSALHIDNDYYTYGGITRPVELHYLPPLYVAAVRAVPVRTGDTWDLNVDVVLRNHGREDLTRRLVLLLDEAETDLGEVTVAAGQAEKVSAVLAELDADAWSADDPVLYWLTALLYDGEGITDDLIERVGFREVKVAGRQLLLNGEPIRLRGYNRHEDHGLFGCAIPLQAIAHDLELMRDLGCNFVRTAHYPNDQRFLDLCDEMGFYVWEESHARNVKFDHPRFREQIAESTREMIRWHVSHPSIIIWGCLNECDSVTKAGRAEYERVIDLIRRLDPSRPVTFASNKSEKDICLGLVDIVSWNRYPGWYGGMPDSVEPDLHQVLRWLREDPASGGADKPVILSEFGGGAIYGCRHPDGAKWTEDYQAVLLDEQLRVYLNHPDVIGAVIWQFADCRVSPGWFNSRPRTHNNKGTVDEFRRPKLVYEVVRDHMNDAIERFG